MWLSVVEPRQMLTVAVCSGCPIPWGIEPAFFIVEGKED